MVDILAISPPSFIDVNRAVYRELAGLGWSVEVVIPDRYEYANGVRLPDAKRADDPLLHHLPLTSGNQRLRTFRGLIGLLGERRPRIIYIDSDPASLMTVQLGFWAKLHRASVVCQACDNLSRTFRAALNRSGPQGLFGNSVIRLLALMAHANVTHIFSINADGLRVFEELGFERKVSQIPLGFDPALFYPSQQMREHTRGQLGLRHTTIAFFGMLRRTKGVHLLIEALEGLMDYDWHLLLDRFEAYRDPYTEHVSALLSRSPVGQRVVFFDAAHRQMPEYINAADIVVLPSISTPAVKEQYGRAISEAMACGRMVIVSESGALPEIVGEAGIRIPENDIPSLREALRRAIETPQLRERLGRLAFERAHADLSTRQQAEHMSRTFEKILSGSGP